MFVAVKDTSIMLDGKVFVYGNFNSEEFYSTACSLLCPPHFQGSVGLVVEVYIYLILTFPGNKCTFD
mgnify:CR=1 FL=1